MVIGIGIGGAGGAAATGAGAPVGSLLLRASRTRTGRRVPGAGCSAGAGSGPAVGASAVLQPTDRLRFAISKYAVKLARGYVLVGVVLSA